MCSQKKKRKIDKKRKKIVHLIETVHLPEKETGKINRPQLVRREAKNEKKMRKK